MSTESRPVPLTQLLGHSQTARRHQVVNSAPVVENVHPTAPEPHPNPTANTEPHINSANPVPSLPTTSPLYRLTATGIYPLPSHMTANPSSTLPQPPHHRIQAEKHNYPHVQRGYTLPESDIYNLEQTDVEQFHAHMQKLGLCITYRTTSNDTYKEIHAQLLAHNADRTKP
ncbi:hypothetical protein ARMGADRAFT_1088398 [Armillaria gallica]|uniref:Uncharacterized protein n=1 Tax=Armillaria gallica TaxID=47427 RepID=A0A2H3D0R5_ARMGA|nr:hypothetical protein ARMGADRAFT_1088398 [Armillaria gallica]